MSLNILLNDSILVAFHISDAEAQKTCTEWKDKYSVVIGVSWGSLPYDLQQKWMSYSCDYHMNSKELQSNSSSGSTADTKGDKDKELSSSFSSSAEAVKSPSKKSVDDFFATV